MTVTFIRKDGAKIVYNKAYEVYQRGRHTKYIVVVYQDELDHNVEAETEHRSDELKSVVITFEG